MSYKIVTDSCCDYTPEMKAWDNLVPVPLTLQVDEFKTLDDETFDQADFIRRMREYEGAAKSACPSIDSWLKAFEGEEEEVFVLTITSQLSGTYNSAVQAAKLYEEDHNDGKKIHVFDGKATSGKLTIIALKIKELKDSGMAFEQVIEEITRYIDNCTLYFCFDNIDNMHKNGRLSSIQSSLLKALRVKLILKETNGNIEKCTQDISINRAVLKMADIVAKQLAGVDTTKEYLIVNHCANEERGRLAYERLTSQFKFKNSWLMGMGGLNTLYTNEGGVLIAFSKGN